jgi:hypothetical protein
MSLLPPIKLPEEQKLETLRRLDQFRHWRSLDDKRYCLACGRLITGWEILVVGGTRGTGPLRVICPTQRCNSIPMDWVVPTDEVLVKFAAAALKPRSIPASRFHFDTWNKSITSRLRKFALRLKQTA